MIISLTNYENSLSHSSHLKFVCVTKTDYICDSPNEEKDVEQRSPAEVRPMTTFSTFSQWGGELVSKKG